MLRNLLCCLILVTGVSTAQQSCTAKANECKDPIGSPKHYPDKHCTCFTCESGTPKEKILCTNDEKEAGQLRARIEAAEKERQVHEAFEKLLRDSAEYSAKVSYHGRLKEENGKFFLIVDGHRLEVRRIDGGLEEKKFRDFLDSGTNDATIEARLGEVPQNTVMLESIQPEKKEE